MSTELHAIRNKVEHADNAAMVKTGKTVQLINQIDTLQLIVGRSHQVSHAIYDNQLNATMVMEVNIKRRANNIQPLFPRLFRQVIGMEELRLRIEISPLDGFTDILVKLGFRLLRVKEQYSLFRRIMDDSKTQRTAGI